MFKQLDLLDQSQVNELKKIAASGKFVDGKISNPHSKIKNNLQLHDHDAYNKSSKIMLDALMSNREFVDFAFPEKVAPPLITRYQPGMNYGLHADSAIIPLPDGPIRSDISCTIFLSDVNDSKGGALHVTQGEAGMRFKGLPGTAIVYPSYTLHEVEPVTAGERMVAITFIQSKIPDVVKRNLLYELNEVAALEGLNMRHENYTRLQAVQYNLMRQWMR
ncbi:Fe2+-dependent dioxygenase [Parasphingorhabdus halotolerans]|uniref:Fe2+-dependent dioxygenase n=1 Tax=Parasphingorhabdus halotolerans TaxID=2725558 RepID=A0A6H2DKC1_9SPHN|nr:Fe2+-dependent dioxygenase [Parasphingorhabdus halotolerans]QJB68395.1 Fe2+-dependent dioxygenase [Parasphingorhabdus halotolerans]